MNKRVLTPPDRDPSAFAFSQKSYLYSQKKLSPSETAEMKTYLIKNGEIAREILGTQLVAQEYLGLVSKISVKTPDPSERIQKKRSNAPYVLVLLIIIAAALFLNFR